jgi:CubicO group peptidase (beta-lactamase class C family)
VTQLEANEAVREVLEGLVSSGQETGLQVAAYLDGHLSIDAWAGLADEREVRPVDERTLFTAFSISKGIVATCIHVLADRGVLHYDAPIATYWPEFAANGKERATVRHALTHQLGIPADPPGFDIARADDWDAVCSSIARLEPLWEPGTKSEYHPLTFGWVLGEVLRRVDGRPIGQFVQQELCVPLGLDGVYFGVPREAEHLVATLQQAPGQELLAMSLTPSMADLANVMNLPRVRHAAIPGAGAIVNARSVARLYAMLAGGGELDGVRILSPESVRLAAAPQAEPEAGRYRWWHAHGLGYTLGGGPGPTEHLASAFGYEGVGTIGFADPSRRFAFALLKNRLDWSANELTTAIVVERAVESALGIS